MTPEFAGQTTVHPIGLTSLLILCVLILFVDRKKVVIPFIIIAVFIAPAQRIVFAGFDLSFLRIVVIISWIRIFLHNEYKHIKIQHIDQIVVVWVLFAIVMYTIQQRSVSGFVNRLGYMVDTAGIYFAFRCLIRTPEDIDFFIQVITAISIPVLIFFVVEKSTGRNIFSVFGGVPAITMVREGRLRVQGAFAHPILAGCFWASILPIIFSKILWYKSERLKMILFFIIFSSLIVLSASSTPIMGAVAGLVGVILFNYRLLVKSLPILSIILYILLDIAMNNPVWHLLARIDISGGSTGWHRYWLIEQAIRNFRQWALWGTPNIDSWNVFANDITNQYILEAVRGGLLTLILFITILFQAAKVAVLETENFLQHKDTDNAYLMWALGASFSVHAVNFIAVSYFGQIIMLQYLILAMIVSLSQYSKKAIVLNTDGVLSE